VYKGQVVQILHMHEENSCMYEMCSSGNELTPYCDCCHGVILLLNRSRGLSVLQHAGWLGVQRGSKRIFV